MADVKISALNELVTAEGADVLVINDDSAIETKKITAANVQDFVLKAPDGNLAAPGVRFAADPDTGLRRVGTNEVALVAGGADAVSATGTAVTLPGTLRTGAGVVGAPALQIAENSGIYRIAAGSLGLVIGGTLEIVFDSAGFSPANTNVIALGTSGARWGPDNFLSAVDISGDLATRALTPAALPAGNSNDYAGANGVTYARLTPNIAGSTITGLADGQDGRLLIVTNVASPQGTLTLAHQNAGSAAANRIITVAGVDAAIPPGGFFVAIYDSTTQRWRQVLHSIVFDTPVSVGSSNSQGTSTSLARADHVHDGGFLKTIEPKYQHPGDTLASDATSEREFYRATGDETVATVLFTGNAARAGNDTNNFTITVRKRDGVGGAAVTVVAYTNDVASGGTSAFQPKNLGSLSNTTLAAGNILTIQVTKGGTGQDLPAGALECVITRSS